ncbi:MAG TPA: hypothetical protein C5S50_02965 [Methanosarcinaceae archaeon]|nr:hypothetical protein [Methanosarcinaceae archaeon]
MVSFESVRRMMGWCPNVSKNDYPVSYTNSASSTIDDTNSSIFSPLFLKNTYVAGLAKETVIGISFILAVGALYFRSGDNSIFYNYGIELILFFTVLMIFAMSGSNVEINSKYIRVSTMLQWILGSTTHTLDSINTIKVQKNEYYRLVYWGLFIVGTWWFFLLLSDIFAGETVAELIQSFVWSFFCFGYGHFIHIASKSVYHIRISFDPNPSINYLMIHTKNAPQIADMIKNTSTYSGDIGLGDAK